MPRYRIRHETRYDYAGAVSDIACTLRLRPIDWPGQRLCAHRLEISPDGYLADERGARVNRQHLEIAGLTEHLTIVSHAEVAVDRLVPLPTPDDPPVNAVPLADDPLLPPVDYLAPSPYAPADADIAAWAGPLLQPGRPVLEAAFGLARRLYEEMRYRPGTTTVTTLPAAAFGDRQGVCQDYAQIMLTALRAHGVPAAYVSGYLPSGRDRLQGAEASHAWVLVWAGPTQRWVGIDPTNALWMAGEHVVTAVGRDYGDVAPVTGVFIGPPGGTMATSVEVEAVASDTEFGEGDRTSRLHATVPPHN